MPDLVCKKASTGNAFAEVKRRKIEFEKTDRFHFRWIFDKGG